MPDISRQEFEEFLTEAELNTWVSGKNKIECSLIMDSKQYAYDRGDWSYVDTYFISEDKRVFWGFEVVYHRDSREQEWQVIMIRQYNGRLADVVDLGKVDALYDYLRQFRKRWLELPLAERRERKALLDPITPATEASLYVYRRVPRTDAEGSFEQETLDYGFKTVLCHYFRRVMMAQLAS